MDKRPKCNVEIILRKDICGRFKQFFECAKYKRRFWVNTTVGQTRELTTEENSFIDGYINKQEG